MGLAFYLDEGSLSFLIILRTAHI